MNIKQQNYKPLGNRVVIKPMEMTEEEMTQGSIRMAESAILFMKGEILSVGRGEVAMQTGAIIPMELKLGDTILFRKECPYLPLIIDGVECRLIREPDVECVLE